MIDNETTPQEAVITDNVKAQVQEFQEVYEPSTISEVFEHLKDLYSSHTEEDPDARAGVISLVNHVRTLCESIVQAPMEHLMV